MKKFIVIAIFAGTYIALTWYSGVVGEKHFAEQIGFASEHLAESGLVLSQSGYERGVFSSRVNLHLAVEQGILTESAPPVGLQARMKIIHGPLLFGFGPGFGAFGASGDLHFFSDDPQAQTLLAEMFAEQPVSVRLVGHYGTTGTSYIQLPPLGLERPDFSFRMDGMEVRGKGDYRDQSAKGSFSVGEIEWRTSGAQGGRVHMSPTLGDFEIQYLASGVGVGSSTLTIDRILYEAMGAQFALQDIVMTASQELVNGRLDATYEMRADSLDTPVASATDVRYYVELNQMDLRVLELWQDLYRLANQPHETEELEAQAEALVNTLLQKGLEFRLGTSAALMGGKASADLRLEYTGLPDGVESPGLEDMAVHLSALQGSFVVKLSEPVVMDTPLIFMLAAHIGETFHWESGVLVLRSELKDGVLTLGNEAIPLAAMMGAFLPGTSPAPQQDPQYWQDEDSEELWQ